MKKYWEAACIAFKTRTAYRFDTAMQTLSGVARVLFAWLLWSALFQGHDQIMGFTLPAMLLYYLIQSVLVLLDNTEQIAKELGTSIRSGTFSKFLVLPVRVQPYLAAQSLGSAAYTAFFSLAAGALCLAVFPVRMALAPGINSLLLAAALLLLGRVFLSQLHFYLGILTFRYQDIWLFLMIKNNVLAFVTGALVPLALLPEPVLCALRLTPFYHVSYLPALLLMGMGGGEAAEGIMVLAAWNLLFFFLNRRTYGYLRTRYDGVGI